jgi:Tfp pilus assembly protein PilE
MFCTKCGNQTNPNDAFCGGCGAPRAATTFSTSGEIKASNQNDKKALYAAVIGPKNTDYYLDYFLKADAKGKAGASWNWPAFFVTFYWMLYRKLWVPAAVYFFAPALAIVTAGVLGTILELSGDASAALIFLVAVAVVYVLPAMYANRLYYKKCNELITQAQRIHNGREDQLQWLAREGNTSRLGMWLAVALIGIAMIGILAAIAIPAYQDYTVRAQVAEGLKLAGQAKAAAVESYTTTGVWPKDNAAAGQAADISNQYVEFVGINGSGITIKFKDSAPVSTPLRGKELYLIAGVAPNGDVIWQCGSGPVPKEVEPQQYAFETSGGGGSLEQKFRPAECRG